MAPSRTAWACVLLLAPSVGPARPPGPPDGPPYVSFEIRVQPGGGFGAFSPDGKWLVAVGGGEIRLFEVPGGGEGPQLQLPAKTHPHVAFAADGKHLYSADQTDRKLRHWNLANGKQVRELDLPPADKLEWVVGFSPDGRQLALKTADGICLVDTETGRVTVELPGAGPGETSFKLLGGAFTRDGKRFAAGAGKGRLGVWDTATGKQLAVTPGGRDRSYAGEFCFVAFAPDDRWVATGNGGVVGQPVQIWNAATGELLAEPVRHNGYGSNVAWAPDGTAVVTTDYDGVRAVDVATGKVVHKFEPPGVGGNLWGGVQGPSPDGKYLAFNRWHTGADKPGSVVLFRMPAPQPPTPPKAELTPAELDALWADLTSVNRIRAAQIQAAAEAAPGSWVPFVLRKVQPAGTDGVQKLRSLIADLDADSPDVRRAAQERLAPQAHRYEPLLRDAQAAAPPGEVRNRLTFLLGRVKDEPPPADLTAELRAVEVLTRVTAPDARRALEALADRAAESRVTRAARDALGGPYPPAR